MAQFTESTALTLTQQKDEQFPVNLEDACDWVGRRKDSAVRTLKKYFIDGEDYTSTQCGTENSMVSAVFYYLTVDCFKQFAMLANTPQGKTVRLHFIAAEKQLKEILENNAAMPPTDARAVLRAAESIRLLYTRMEKSPIRDALVTASGKVLGIDFLALEELSAPAPVTDERSQALLESIQKKGPSTARELQMRRVLNRFGLTKATEYRELLTALVAAGNLELDGKRYRVQKKTV